MEIKEQLETLKKMVFEELEEGERVVERQRLAINGADAKMVSITNIEFELCLRNLKRHVAKLEIIKDAAERDYNNQFTHG